MSIKFNNISLMIIFLLYLIVMISTSNTGDRDEISLTIDSTKGDGIITDFYYDDILKVIVNGKESNIFNYRNYLDEGENEITIIFIYKLYSCQYMFYQLENILYINLSNIDLSKVIYMEYMFYNCFSLKSIV